MFVTAETLQDRKQVLKNSMVNTVAADSQLMRLMLNTKEEWRAILGAWMRGELTYGETLQDLGLKRKKEGDLDEPMCFLDYADLCRRLYVSRASDMVSSVKSMISNLNAYERETTRILRNDEFDMTELHRVDEKVDRFHAFQSQSLGAFRHTVNKLPPERKGKLPAGINVYRKRLDDHKAAMKDHVEEWLGDYDRRFNDGKEFA
ncbi:MAG: hypothetical protein HYS81_00625 [Candidatus Aenigmatarchaeota archaeon]|nr:MAG: hypothetical protein HYS81_00625 [Candidatus Aenigmarchaeota archaeon]